MLVMTPGPIALDHRVIAAMARPAITPESGAFMETLEKVFVDLGRLFDTRSWVTLVPGTGRMGIEAALISALDPGDKTAHVVNGSFGGLAVDIALRAGAQATVIESPWGGPLDLETIERTLAQVRPKLLSVVHSETSTGAYYDLGTVGKLCRSYDTLFLVDAVSSVANMPMSMDRLDADLVIGASNKGVGAVHGLAMVGVSQRACRSMEARKTVCHSWSLDLRRWNDMYFAKSAGRRSATPPSTHLVYALQEALRLLFEEGIESHWKRCERYAQATRSAVRAAGLELFPDPALASSCVTAVRIPEGLQADAILKDMLANGVQIAGTVARPSPISGRLLRISHQGVQASCEMLVPTLGALENTLRRLGHNISPGSTVAAFEASLQAQPK